jgi:hypothetical protein
MSPEERALRAEFAASDSDSDDNSGGGGFVGMALPPGVDPPTPSPYAATTHHLPSLHCIAHCVVLSIDSENSPVASPRASLVLDAVADAAAVGGFRRESSPAPRFDLVPLSLVVVWCMCINR